MSTVPLTVDEAFAQSLTLIRKHSTNIGGQSVSQDELGYGKDTRPLQIALGGGGFGGVVNHLMKKGMMGLPPEFYATFTPDQLRNLDNVDFLWKPVPGTKGETWTLMVKGETGVYHAKANPKENSFGYWDYAADIQPHLDMYFRKVGGAVDLHPMNIDRMIQEQSKELKHYIPDPHLFRQMHPDIIWHSSALRGSTQPGGAARGLPTSPRP